MQIDHGVYSDVEEVTVDKAELLQAIRYDCVTFLAFYLQEELTLEVPDFHEEIWEELLEVLERINSPEMAVGVLQKLLAIPREHAKTTIIKLAVILFMRYSHLSFTAYVSKTFGNALNALKDVKDWFLSPQESELYGPATVEKSSDTTGEIILWIHVPWKEEPKCVIMKAYGQGTQIRGAIIKSKRPDLLIFDDIEDRDTLEPKVQEKLDAWALGTAKKALAKKGVIIFIGNMISETTLLARLSKDPKWNPTVFGAIIKTKEGVLRPLWEGRWTLQALIEDYMDYRRKGLGHIWEAELMNLTGSEIFGASLSKSPRIPLPNPEDLEAGFLCLDPAFGLKTWNDDSAITLHARVKGYTVPYVIASRVGKMNEEAIFQEMYEMSLYWGITTWVIEAVAAQRLLIPLFKMFCIQRGMPPEVFTLLPITAGREAKASRIVAFRSLCAQGSYGFTEEEEDLVLKLEKYSPESNEPDDHCDSAAYGTQVWSLYGEVVKDNSKQDIAGRIQQATGGGVTLGNSICPF